MGLLEEFERSAASAAASVERVPRSPDRLAAAVVRAAGGTRRIAVAASHDLPAELLDAVRRLPQAFTGRSKSELSTADAGVTEAFAGVARTGSVCVCLDHEFTGAVSLLVRQHIAVLLAESIVERPADLLKPDCLGGAGLRRNFVFVTGPSATADMGPLVRGVHGPHRLHVIVLV